MKRWEGTFPAQACNSMEPCSGSSGRWGGERPVVQIYLEGEGQPQDAMQSAF